MTENELFTYVLKGHREAIGFMTTLSRITSVIDDLVDEDKPVSMHEKQALFWNMLVALPNNTFYRTHFERLNPLVTHGLNDWFVANELERADSLHDKRVAYVIRNNVITVLCEAVLLVGGEGWLRQHAVMIRRHVHEETFSDFQTGLRNQAQGLHAKG